MSEIRIQKLRSLQLDVTDLDRSLDFYTRVWGLTLVGKGANGCHYLRATGEEHHVVRLMPSDTAALGLVSFAVDDRLTVDLFHEKAIREGVGVLQKPHELNAEAGGGYGVLLAGPEGIQVEISADMKTLEAIPDEPAKPINLTHVVINAANMLAMRVFFLDFLGFMLSDTTSIMAFTRCPADGAKVDHHTVALSHASHLSLNHAAFEMRDIDSLMYGAGRLIENGYDIEWGLGRHGPGNNVFTYYVDPDGFAVEYTTEMQKIDDSYVTNEAEYWSSFPKRPCRWGVARKPSDRLIQAMAGKGLLKKVHV